jgi:hypothetical protein
MDRVAPPLLAWALLSVAACKPGGSPAAPPSATTTSTATASASAPAASAPEATPSLARGDRAPDFSLEGSDGKTHALADHAGKEVVVVAWFPKAFTGG